MCPPHFGSPAEREADDHLGAGAQEDPGRSGRHRGNNRIYDMKRSILGLALLALTSCNSQSKQEEAKPAERAGKAGKVTRSEAEWKKQLTPEQYDVLRLEGTERPFTGQY